MSDQKSGIFSIIELIAKIFIPLILAWFTHLYNEHNKKIQKIEVYAKCFKYLISNDPKEREFGYFVFDQLGESGFALRIIHETGDTAGLTYLKFKQTASDSILPEKTIKKIESKINNSRKISAIDSIFINLKSSSNPYAALDTALQKLVKYDYSEYEKPLINYLLNGNLYLFGEIVRICSFHTLDPFSENHILYWTLFRNLLNNKLFVDKLIEESPNLPEEIRSWNHPHNRDVRLYSAFKGTYLDQISPIVEVERFQ